MNKNELLESLINNPNYKNPTNLLNNLFNLNQVPTILDTTLSKYDNSISNFSKNIEVISLQLLDLIDTKLYDKNEMINKGILNIEEGISKMNYDITSLNYRAKQAYETINQLEYEFEKVKVLLEKRDEGLQTMNVNNSNSIFPINLIEISQEIKLTQENIDSLTTLKSWSNLESEIHSALEQNNFIVAAKRYSTAEASLNNNKMDSNIWKERSIILERCNNSLLSYYREPLNEAVKNHDGTSLKNLFSAYSILGHEDKVISRYIKEISNNLIREFKVKNIKILGNNSKLDQIKLFLNDFLGLISKEIKWCLSIFESGTHLMVLKWIKYVLENVNESFFYGFDEEISDNEYIILQYNYVITHYSYICNFITSVENILFTLMEPYLSNNILDEANLLEDNQDSPSTEMELSHSVQENDERHNELNNHLRNILNDFGEALKPTLSPYVSFQQTIQKYEQLLIKEHTQNAKYDTFDNLYSIINKVFNKLGNNQTDLTKFGIESILSRCKTFTHGFSTLETMDTFNIILIFPLNAIEELVKAVKLKNDDSLFNNYQTDWQQFQLFIKYMDVLEYFESSYNVFCHSLIKELDKIHDIVNFDLINQPKETLLNILFLHSNNYNLELHPITAIKSIQGSILNNQALHEFFDKNDNEETYSKVKIRYLNVIQDKLTELYQLTTSLMVFLLSNPFNLMIDSHFKSLSNNPTSPLSKFSLPPSNFITMIGEGLLTLPQRLESYLDENGFCKAFKYLELSNIIYKGVDIDIQSKSLKLWIQKVADSVMMSYLKTMSDLKDKSNLNPIQISTDINYIFNVLKALSIIPSHTLVIIQGFLRQKTQDLAKMKDKIYGCKDDIEMKTTISKSLSIILNKSNEFDKLILDELSKYLENEVYFKEIKMATMFVFELK